MTSAVQRPPRAGGLGGVAVAAGILGLLLLAALLAPVEAYIRAYMQIFDVGAVPILWVIALGVGIVAVRSGRRVDSVLGIVSLVLAGLVALTVAGYVMLGFTVGTPAS